MIFLKNRLVIIPLLLLLFQLSGCEQDVEASDGSADYDLMTEVMAMDIGDKVTGVIAEQILEGDTGRIH